MSKTKARLPGGLVKHNRDLLLFFWAHNTCLTSQDPESLTSSLHPCVLALLGLSRLARVRDRRCGGNDRHRRANCRATGDCAWGHMTVDIIMT